VRRYIKLYDGIVREVHKYHPDIKFVGNCLSGRGDAQDSLVWRTFLNRSEHAQDLPWPIDAVSFHLYTGIHPDPGKYGAARPVPPWSEWSGLLLQQAQAAIPSAVAATTKIKLVSPSTKVFVDEVGICNICAGSVGYMDMNSTLGNRSNATFWNTGAVTWALWYGELAATRVDMMANSQLLGNPAGPPGSPVGRPSTTPSAGTLYQPQVSAWGNCPDLSMLDWTDGSGNARFHTEKMMIDSLGSGFKNVLSTAVTASTHGASAAAPTR
jgi:hypothetical protein